MLSYQCLWLSLFSLSLTANAFVISGAHERRGDTQCNDTIGTIEPQTWRRLQVDRYLQQYPNAATISLSEFAAQNGGINFICGIGQSCHASQPCSPVTAPAWNVLFAAQQWNNFQNMYFHLVADVATAVTSITASMVADLYVKKKKDSSLFDLSNILDLPSGLASLPSVVLGLSPFGQAAATVVDIAVASGQSSTAGYCAATAAKKPMQDVFSQWAECALEISQWQMSLQGQIKDYTERLITQGIGAPDGLAHVLKDGAMFKDNSILIQTSKMDTIRKIIMVRVLAELMKAQGGYVTIGSDKCEQGGLNGAFKLEKKWLSYCDSDGLMKNIIYASGNNARNEWTNGHLIIEKYGLSVEYLTNQAWNCQQKYGRFSYNPYEKSAFPIEADAECLFNLPVCDCRDSAIARGRRAGRGTTITCRDVGKLPI